MLYTQVRTNLCNPGDSICNYRDGIKIAEQIVIHAVKGPIVSGGEKELIYYITKSPDSDHMRYRPNKNSDQLYEVGYYNDVDIVIEKEKYDIDISVKLK